MGHHIAAHVSLIYLTDINSVFIDMITHIGNKNTLHILIQPRLQGIISRGAFTFPGGAPFFNTLVRGHEKKITEKKSPKIGDFNAGFQDVLANISRTGGPICSV